MPVPLDLQDYGARAERFVIELDREYYLHFAGHKETFGVEPIYERHADLFQRGAVEALRELAGSAPPGDEERRRRFLLRLAVEGFIGLATKAQSAALAEREASLEVEVNGQRRAYRELPIAQANEPDPERRASIERAWLEVLEAELNPLYAEITEVAHRLSVELGFESYRAMYGELKAIDLAAFEHQTRAFAEATEELYPELVAPKLQELVGVELDALRRSDLAYFFRARAYDRLFPADTLVEAFERTLEGLGINLREQAGLRLDLEQRPRKSPRAFCAPVRVPAEVYLVIPRRGGRDDYAALFHEGGHAEHYASVDPGLPFEFRHLGDNSVTEGFAFLFEHLIEDPAWLRLTVGAQDVSGCVEYARASKLIFLRRYAAKLSYELELHAEGRPLAEMRALYARELGDALGVEWPEATYLSDVDPGYYAANYLRAWAFEAQLRRSLRERFGPEWFTRAEAGEVLRSLWRQGQRLGAEELLAEATGRELDFSLMIEEVASP